MELPKEPMAPVSSEQIPTGIEWVYQLKWDGVRTLARLDGRGEVELFSKRVESKTAIYPEIVELLQRLRLGPCVFDGEICSFDGTRPNFQKIRLRPSKKHDESIIFVVFDLLYHNGEDIRSLPFTERYERLQSLLPDPQPRLLISDIYEDGQALWEWVVLNAWEGVVSKRKNSPYVSGKSHKYWYKKRIELQLTCEVVGAKLSGGSVTSLMLRYDNRYVGHVSGLTNAAKEVILDFALQHPGSNPFNFTPRYKVMWLAVPFAVRISALEFTDSGKLRQPKLIGFGE